MGGSGRYYLSEHLKRLLAMNDQMARVQERLSETSGLVGRDLELMKSGPLDSVRDYRLSPDAERLEQPSLTAAPRSSDASDTDAARPAKRRRRG